MDQQHKLTLTQKKIETGRDTMMMRTEMSVNKNAHSPGPSGRSRGVKIPPASPSPLTSDPNGIPPVLGADGMSCTDPVFNQC